MAAIAGRDPGVQAVMRPILMPLPDRDFDPTEAAIPWKVCTSRGFGVVISTENGTVPQGDPHRLEGPFPGLVTASHRAQAAYKELAQDPAFLQPIPYASIDASQFVALLLPGGDGPGVRQYLDSSILWSKVLEFGRQHKLIGAICHGVLILARTIDPQTGRSPLYGHKMTAPPKALDVFGYLLDRWVVKHGYVMYSRCVADEVRSSLRSPRDLSFGRSLFKPYVVRDGTLITSRWYLDAELFGRTFADALAECATAA